MRPSRDRQNRSFFSARARKAPGKQWHVVVVAISPPGVKKKTKKGKKNARFRDVSARGFTHLAVRSARRSGEIRNLSGSERRGCGEHFLFACRVCSFSNGFRLDPEKDFIANSLHQGVFFSQESFFCDQTSSFLFFRPFASLLRVCTLLYYFYIILQKREERRERKRIIHRRHHHGDGRGE
jgi:hypothetical protein